MAVGLDKMEPPVERTDEEWMLRLKAGHKDAFDVLVGKYRTPVIHFLYRIVHEPALAEELAQEVFLRVYRARTRYQPRARFSTWMFRIATNVGLNALRDGRMRRARETSMHEDHKLEGAVAAAAHPAPTAEETMLEAERSRQIRQAVEALPEKQRLAVLMHKYQELDYSEIADVLDCSESALKSLLFRAYETLRVRLRPLLGVRQ
ncbi:MAG: RNA polymerase sigma factor [Terriglobia bacterium]